MRTCAHQPHISFFNVHTYICHTKIIPQFSHIQTPVPKTQPKYSLNQKYCSYDKQSSLTQIVTQNSHPNSATYKPQFQKHSPNIRWIKNIVRMTNNPASPKLSHKIHTIIKNRLPKLIHRGEKMTKHVTISISMREKPVRDAWKQYPANKNTSAALMRLVRYDLKTRRAE